MAHRVVPYLVSAGHGLLPAIEPLSHPPAGQDEEGRLEPVFVEYGHANIHLALTGVVEAQTHGRPLALRPCELVTGLLGA
jgi:hypothetical protein